ncbi:large ribosomal subunit protein eL6 [Bacillus rossius redtenbacheri]|uniref:large ribosomal subunit protein eL6 n=1 Tax=Bacillus rossius redtenbacheri TaxID=93214 RepID=UPI002FDCD19A
MADQQPTPAKETSPAKDSAPAGDAKPGKRGKRGDKPEKKEKKKRGKARNYDLGNGVYRFSHSNMYHKKAVYKFVGKKTPKTVRPKKPITMEKPIGGEKNGGTRIVLLKKRRNYYPTADKIKRRPAKKLFSQHRRYTRPSLVPGTVVILLAGVQKGKRVILLKCLKSGLLLVTGPHKVNGCPLRRVSQNYVIATSTRLSLKGFKLPKHIDDAYFKRNKAKRAKKEDGDIFNQKKEAYKPSEQRKTDQKVVDKQLVDIINKHPEKKDMFRYLVAMFGLRSSQYPHRLKF